MLFNRQGDFFLSLSPPQTWRLPREAWKFIWMNQQFWVFFVRKTKNSLSRHLVTFSWILLQPKWIIINVLWSRLYRTQSHVSSLSLSNSTVKKISFRFIINSFLFGFDRCYSTITNSKAFTSYKPPQSVTRLPKLIPWTAMNMHIKFPLSIVQHQLDQWRWFKTKANWSQESFSFTTIVQDEWRNREVNKSKVRFFLIFYKLSSEEFFAAGMKDFE